MRRTPVLLSDIAHIPLTRGMVAVVDLVDAVLGRDPWYASPDSPRDNWYAKRSLPAAQGERLTSLHVEVAKRAGIYVPGLEIDHVDGDGLNCRRGNLRAATANQNGYNRGLTSRNKSGYKGVSLDKRTNKWKAQITVDRKKRILGYFATPELASAAYDQAAAEFHGVFRRKETEGE